MSFVTTSPPPETAEPVINTGSFWPQIDPVEIREENRIDNTVTAARLRSALIEAISTVNQSLETWKTQNIALGYTSLANVPADQIDNTSIYIQKYQRAVGCYAKAIVLERYRNYDTTNAGNKKADQLDPEIDDLKRDAIWATNDIMGIRRTTVELI